MKHAASWADEFSEWQAIKDEMIDAGKTPTAFDVTSEQRRRMKKRGERPMTMEEVYANPGFTVAEGHP